MDPGKFNCEKCGVELHPGDWPYCPHGKGTYNIAFKGAGWTGKSYDKKNANPNSK